MTLVTSQTRQSCESGQEQTQMRGEGPQGFQWGRAPMGTGTRCAPLASGHGRRSSLVKTLGTLGAHCRLREGGGCRHTCHQAPWSPPTTSLCGDGVRVYIITVRELNPPVKTSLWIAGPQLGRLSHHTWKARGGRKRNNNNRMSLRPPAARELMMLGKTKST